MYSERERGRRGWSIVVQQQQQQHIALLVSRTIYALQVLKLVLQAEGARFAQGCQAGRLAGYTTAA